MAYSAAILADSISPQGHRLTTMLTRYPRFVHAEHLRHRGFSFSVASSRALPTKTLLAQVMEDPVLPVYWGKYDRGMGAKEELTGRQRDKAERLWLQARDKAVEHAQFMLDFGTVPYADAEDMEVGLSKELVNRILETWMWVTVVSTGTDSAWKNFFWLRCHPAAQPEIRVAAEMMELEYNSSSPKLLHSGTYHMPFVTDDDWNDAYALANGEVWDPEGWRGSVSEYVDRLNGTQELLCKVSAARCARTSYLTHEGKRSLIEDVGLYDRLLEGAQHEPEDPMHLSPLEHVATPIPDREYAKELQGAFKGREWLRRQINKRGNLEGWESLRWQVPDENGVEPYQRRLAALDQVIP